MKATFRTLYQQVFALELDPQTTVLGIKKEIEKEQGYSMDLQKIIYAGKILKDTDTLETLKYQEKDFMVLMVTKVASANKKEAQENETATAGSTKTSVPPSASENVTVMESDERTAQGAKGNEVEGYTESTLTTGENYNNAVNRLMEMGFSRPHVVLAMRAAFNNPDRAAEYLISGIPSHIREGLSTSSPSTSSQTQGSNNPQNAETENAPVNFFEVVATEAARRLQSISPELFDSISPETREQLEQLASSPQFNHIRQMIASDPQAILPILRQLGRINPKLFQFLTNNQDQLFRLLGEDPGTQSGAGENQSRSWSGYDPSAIYITTEENAAIERLSALGFERSLAIEAFFACDKNEELAANYLFNLGQGLN